LLLKLFNLFEYNYKIKFVITEYKLKYY